MLLSPVTIRLHRRLGVVVPVALVVLVAAIDLVAFGASVRRLLAVNILLVWLLPHQLGYFYADGRLKRLSTASMAVTAVVALLTMALLTTFPIYSRNMLDTGVTIFGITAPTLPIAAMSVWIIAAAMALRPVLSRWLVNDLLSGSSSAA